MILATLGLLPAILTFASPVAASCGHGLWMHPFEGLDTVPIPKFTYGLETGPLNWHNLNATYALCGKGTDQSPILIDSTASPVVGAGSVKVTLPNAKNAVFENQGTNVEVIVNGTLEAGNSTWKLAQFHFHTPSEHRVDFAHADAEMHFVFANTDGKGKIAVVGFLIDVAAKDSTPLLDTVFAHLDEIKTPGTTTKVPSIDFKVFQDMVNAQSYYHYSGSLTTPPCTEGVSWYLSTKTIPLNVEMYLNLKSITKTNNRYTQNTPGSTDILEIAAAGL